MVQTLDNITMQARRGSVAAIIQVLNDALAESDVRARAVVAQGVLQLLCEADNPRKLEQTHLVEELRTVLERIRPRYVRRVRVNTRLVSEHQLLWLDEIERDPDSQLLWTAEFAISRPNWLQQFRELWRLRENGRKRSGAVLADTAQRERQKRRMWQSIVGLGGLGLFVCLLGWAVYGSLGSGGVRQLGAIGSSSASSDGDLLTSSTSLQDTPTSQSAPVSTPLADPLPQSPVSDPFAQAVRLAEQSVEDGKSATTVSEWMELAARWQRASELMESVPPEDERYAIAQDRTTVYLQNSVDSRKQAELVRLEEGG